MGLRATAREAKDLNDKDKRRAMQLEQVRRLQAPEAQRQLKAIGAHRLAADGVLAAPEGRRDDLARLTQSNRKVYAPGALAANQRVPNAALVVVDACETRIREALLRLEQTGGLHEVRFTADQLDQLVAAVTRGELSFDTFTTVAKAVFASRSSSEGDTLREAASLLTTALGALARFLGRDAEPIEHFRLRMTSQAISDGLTEAQRKKWAINCCVAYDRSRENFQPSV